ncbi:MAG: diguanylate cyclase [Spirochaetaceae bacterium]
MSKNDGVFRKKENLQWEIVNPYSKLIVLISVLIILISSALTFYNSIQFIKEVELERSSKISQEVLSFLDLPLKAVEENINLYNIGILDDLSVNEIRILFTNQYHLYTDLTLIGIGLEDGTYIDVQYFSNNSLYFSERDSRTGDYKGRIISYDADILSLNNEMVYDHRLRPWYQNVIKNNDIELKWTPIYTSITPKALFITATKPIFNDINKFMGVMVSSLSLTRLTNILSSIKNIGDAKILIVENNGDIVASTEHKVPFSQIDDELKRINISSIDNQLYKKIYSFMEKSDRDVELVWNNLELYFLDSYNINDDRGINWEMIILHPIESIINQIILKIVIIVIITFFINFIGIIIGRNIAKNISEPIISIKNAANDIVHGNLDSRSKVFKNNEVGQMAISFNVMGDTINSLINNLEEKVKERSRELELSQKKLSLHVENTPLAVIEWDNDFNITSWNKSAENIFGYSEAEIIGIHSIELLLSKEKIVEEKVKRVLDSLKKNEGEKRSININITKDGRIIHCDWYNTALVDSHGIVYGSASLVLDITHQVKYLEQQDRENQQLEYMSYIDGLTNIANRRSFDLYIGKELERAFRNKTKVSLIMADIDFFKDFNDKNGHVDGDECLKMIAGAINKSARRPADKAFRYGGEEFTFVLPETDIVGAMFAAQQIKESVKALKIPHEKSSISDIVTLSMGVASIVPNKGFTPEDLINLADKRLYKAKESGRDCIKDS